MDCTVKGKGDLHGGRRGREKKEDCTAEGKEGLHRGRKRRTALQKEKKDWAAVGKEGLGCRRKGRSAGRKERMWAERQAPSADSLLSLHAVSGGTDGAQIFPSSNYTVYTPEIKINKYNPPPSPFPRHLQNITTVLYIVLPLDRFLPCFFSFPLHEKLYCTYCIIKIFFPFIHCKENKGKMFYTNP